MFDLGNEDVFQISIIAVCLVLSGFFSAAETAITSLGSLKAKHLIDSQGKAVRQLNLWLTYPGRVLTTILIYNNVVNILASAIATDLAARHFESQAIGIATGGITFFVLIFGEIIPKSFAKAHHERFAIFLMRFIYVIYYASYPVVYALSEFASRIVKLFGSKDSGTPPITEEELEFLINVGERAGVIEETKKDMIASVFEFDETKVREIMTPRTDIRAVGIDCTFEESLNIAIESGFSRIPVYDENIDNIVGVLLVKDLLKLARKSENGLAASFSVEKIIREPFFIPESKLIIDVFKELKRTKNHISIVIDEHGGTAGLITLEDILEEIVGEIQDEFDTEEADILEIEDGIFDVAGSLNVADFLEFFDLEDKDLSEGRDDDVDTLAGWVTQLVGDLPEVGKKVQIGPFSVEVAEAEKQRIQRLRVKKTPNKAHEGLI
jgi:putative hemolysin